MTSPTKISPLPSPENLQDAVVALRNGGVIAYPTEAVWGLGCDPFNEQAVRKILALKERPDSKGLIIIAASVAQVAPWLESLSPGQRAAVEASWPGPYTWIVPAPTAPRWLRGEHDGLAIRVSAHPAVIALCEAWGGALVSTSANRSGQPPLANAEALHEEWGSALDAILIAPLGGDKRPSEIRDATTGIVLRRR
jgi:L-threonylcarbamoyladenylate synthase